MSFINDSNMRRVIKDTPLMELTLRRYEKPQGNDKRELLRKFCLSMGLLQPGDSRDIIVDILHVLLRAKKERLDLSSVEIRDRVETIRNEYKLPLLGIAGSNVRRQIKRLRDILLVQKVKSSYRIREFSKMHDIFDESIEKYLLPAIVSRTKEYCDTIDQSFR
jgi:hypothetical protein